ncbi:putative F-box domain-containing protein [Helianthus anomalus]
MSDYIPEELVFDILSRLPSKSLLRFRSVCKSWCSLISSSNFKSAHLKTFNLSNPRNFIRHFDLMVDKEYCSVHFDDEALTMVPDTLIEFPFRFCNYCTLSFLRMIGCVNGVVCLFHGNCDTYEDKIILWNPSIKKQLIVTPAMFNLGRAQYWCLIYGFGYDETTDDFKVLRLAYDFRLFSTPRVEVYSVKNGVSRAWFPNDLPCNYSTCLDAWSQVFYNGCVHWIICDYAIGGSTASILTFDMSTERFGSIALPKYLVKKPAFYLKLTVVRGCLTVIYTKRPRFSFPGPSGYIISAMTEYKNTDSWALIYDVQFPYDMGRVLRLRENGGILMGSGYGDLKFFDFHAGYFLDSYSRFVVEDAIYIGGYQESLALLDEGRPERDAEQDE